MLGRAKKVARCWWLWSSLTGYDGGERERDRKERERESGVELKVKEERGREGTEGIR